MRLIQTYRDGTARIAKVYWDYDAREYTVRLYLDGALYAPADYFTDDHADALATAKLMVKEPKKGNSI